MMKQDATNVPIPNEFNDDKDFWPHEICKNYEASRNGIVRNIKTKNEVGHKKPDGYFKFSCSGDCCRGDMKNKNHYIHRFIFEAFNGLIEDGFVIDHIDNNPSNNNLDNLQLITRSENSKKDYKDRSRKAKKIMAINVKTGETFIYKSQNGAAVDLGLHRGNIYRVLNGSRKTILSKKYGERFTFRKVDRDYESNVIIIKNKIKIPISHVKRMIVNNNN